MRRAFVVRATFAFAAAVSTNTVFAAPEQPPTPAAPAPTAPASSAPAAAASSTNEAAKALMLGKPQRSTAVALRVEDDAIVGRMGMGPELRIPAHGARDFSLRPLPVGNNAAVLLIETSSSQGHFSHLVGGVRANELLVSGRTELHGDPGERHGQTVIARAEGEPTVSWATLLEGVTACGEGPVALSAQQVDARTLRLGALRHAVVPPASFPELPVTAIEDAGAPGAVPALRPGAFASAQLDSNIAMATRPSELVDGDTATARTLRDDDFVQFKWPRSAPSVERVELWLSDKAPQDQTVWLRADGGKGALIKLPKGARAVSVSLGEPWATSCLALGAVGAKAAVSLSELRVFSGLDRPDYVASLVGLLVQDGPEGVQASERLASLGARGALAIAPRFDELSTRGKQRALKALSNALGEASVRARVVEAARAPEPSLSQGALNVLAESGEHGRAELRGLAREPTQLGDRAAQALGARAGEVPALFAALLAEHGGERPDLRQTLVSQARREPDAFDAELGRASTAELAAGPRTALAMVAAAAGRPAAAECVARALESASAFDDRFRLATIAKDVGPSSAIDSWLATQSTGAQEWMQRFTAFDALAARAPEIAGGLAPQLLKDPYPRVRARAVGQLRKGADDPLLSRSAKDDFWPLVRVAGAETLAKRPELRGELTALLDDPSRKVRAAVIAGLASQGARDQWPAIEVRLRADSEWTEVRVAASKFAADLCIQQARDPLVYVVRRGLRHEANEDEQFLAARALEALHALGGLAADDAKLLVEREGAPEPLKKLLASLPPSTCAAK